MRTLLFVATLSASMLDRSNGSSCPNSCSGHGTCQAGTCLCANGYGGGDCSLRTCPSSASWANVDVTQDDAAHDVEECSGKGLCDRKTGKCVCMNGFGGHACERTLCGESHFETCNGRGKCMTMADFGTLKDDVVGFYDASYTSIWDATKITGCVCDATAYGPHCEYLKCPSGDDPMTTGQSNEVQEIYCLCPGTCSGSFRVKFRGMISPSIAFDADETALKTAIEKLKSVDEVTVALQNGETQICSASGTSALVTFLTQSGNLPSMSIVRNAVSSTGGAVTLEVREGGSGQSSDGTTEDAPCSNRGYCDAKTGTCTCEVNFESSDGQGGPGSRGDCGYIADPSTVTECPYGRSLAGYERPYEEPCSGHGLCDTSTYTCTCFEGWTGADCQDQQCPFGPAWFDEATATDVAHASAECSNRGVCDRFYGKCTCDDGFEGAACERMTCNNDCNEHGRCLTLAEIASLHGRTYGTDPNAMETWDAHRVTACVCDTYDFSFGIGHDGNVTDWVGFDCSQRTCPHGNPVWNHGARHEEQRVTCIDDGSGDPTIDGFTFAFGDVTSDRILSTAKASRSDSNGDGSSVEEIIEAMTTVGDVEVSFEDSAIAACTPSPGTVISIVFITNHGDLDLGSVGPVSGSTGITSVTIAEEVAGETESVECAGAGICDRLTGTCRCFKNRVSSNGANAPGVVGDCGLPEALYRGV